MQILAILFAISAAVVGFIGRMKAAPLVPSYANKFRSLPEVLERAFWSRAKLLRYLHGARFRLKKASSGHE